MQALNSDLAGYLSRLNSTFGTTITAEGLPRAREVLLRHLDYLKHNEELPDVPLLLANSTEYARYEIARRFGIIDHSADPALIEYSAIKSRMVEMTDAAMKGN